MLIGASFCYNWGMLYDEIKRDNNNVDPIYAFHKNSKILIIGQAPGPKTLIPFKDKSGEKLIDWLGIDETTFRDVLNFSILPMDFYYPGKGKAGDKPPRKEFAEKWHPQFIDQMKDLELTLLIGTYSQKYYLNKRMKKNLTETVKSFKEYLPQYFPLVHPSPLNFRWQGRNPWFEKDVIPELQKLVHHILKK